MKTIFSKLIYLIILFFLNSSAFGQTEKNFLIGSWRLTEYDDNRVRSDSEKNRLQENIENMKESVLLTFFADSSFTRDGFTSDTQKGFWQYSNDSLYLIPLNSDNREFINIVEKSDSLFSIQVSESVENFESDTFEIIFKRNDYNSNNEEYFVGEWKIKNYKINNDKQRKTEIDLIREIKEKGKIIFNENYTFIRYGFSDYPEIGRWEFDKSNNILSLFKNEKLDQEINVKIKSKNLVSFYVLNEYNLGSIIVTTYISFKKQ